METPTQTGGTPRGVCSGTTWAHGAAERAATFTMELVLSGEQTQPHDPDTCQFTIRCFSSFQPNYPHIKTVPTSPLSAAPSYRARSTDSCSHCACGQDKNYLYNLYWKYKLCWMLFNKKRQVLSFHLPPAYEIFGLVLSFLLND